MEKDAARAIGKRNDVVAKFGQYHVVGFGIRGTNKARFGEEKADYEGCMRI